MTDPFAQKIYLPMQNNIDPNFGDELNFVTCEHSFTCSTNNRENYTSRSA